MDDSDAALVEVAPVCSLLLRRQCSSFFSVPPSGHPMPQLVQRTRTLYLSRMPLPVVLFSFAHPPHPENRQKLDGEIPEPYHRTSVCSGRSPPPVATSPRTHGFNPLIFVQEALRASAHSLCNFHSQRLLSYLVFTRTNDYVPAPFPPGALPSWCSITPNT